MAYGYSTSAWGRIKPRIKQWESTHGRKVPPSVLREWLNAELEAEAGRSQESRRTDVAEKQAKDVLDLNRERMEKELALREKELGARAEEAGAQQEIAREQVALSRETARKAAEQREKEFETQTRLTEEAQKRQDELLKQQERAAAIQGYGQLGLSAVGLYGLGKEVGLWGTKTPTTTPQPTTAQTSLTPSGSPTAELATSELASTGLIGASASGAGLIGASASGAGGIGGAAGGGSGIGASVSATGSLSFGKGGGVGLSAAVPYLGAGAAGGVAGYFVGGLGADLYEKNKWVEDWTPWGGAKTERTMSGVSAGIGAGALAGSMVMPGVGTIIGGVIGGIAGGVASSVICTELNRQGYIPNDVLEIEHIFRKKYIDDETYWGYRLLADPVVRWMQKSRLVTQIVKPFGVAFAYEMASRVSPKYEGNKLGKTILRLGVPLCRFVFRWKFGKMKEACDGRIG